MVVDNFHYYAKYHHRKIFSLIVGLSVVKDTLNNQTPYEVLDKLQSISNKNERHTIISIFTLEVLVGRKQKESQISMMSLKCALDIGWNN